MKEKVNEAARNLMSFERTKQPLFGVIDGVVDEFVD